jgi:hypothetical protein
MINKYQLLVLLLLMQLALSISFNSKNKENALTNDKKESS